MSTFPPAALLQPPLMEATHFQPARAALTFTFSTFFTSFVSCFFTLFSVPSLFPYVLCRGAFLTTLFFPRAQSGHLHIPPPPTGSLRQTSMDLFRCEDMKMPHFGQSFGLCQDEFVRLCPAGQHHHCSQWGCNQSCKYRG